ncbi:hypothetical protein BHM03_00011185 [Ensete ventricosum]|nr:hypothetical protein BHM03_00011185 [Ensete ventricosum]
MAARTIRAVQYAGYGGGAAALQHVEIQVPSPKKDEVLLRVEAASINPADWKVQKGMMRPFLPSKFPFVPGAHPTSINIRNGLHSRLLLSLCIYCQKAGGLAEYAVAPVNGTVHIPPEVSAADAAGLPIAACSALQAMRYATTKFDGTGDPANVLVTAASGGVGTFAVQLAKLGNLHVTATCGARNMELVRSLGADEVLDYKTPEGKSLQSPSGRKYDIVVHCTSSVGWSSLEPNLAAHGKVVDLNPTPGVFLRSALNQLTCSNKKLVPLIAAVTKEDLQFLVELVKGGKLKTAIDSRYALGKAEEAWAKSMDGHATGKIIVECDQGTAWVKAQVPNPDLLRVRVLRLSESSVTVTKAQGDALGRADRLRRRVLRPLVVVVVAVGGSIHSAAEAIRSVMGRLRLSNPRARCRLWRRWGRNRPNGGSFALQSNPYLVNRVGRWVDRRHRFGGFLPAGPTRGPPIGPIVTAVKNGTNIFLWVPPSFILGLSGNTYQRSRVPKATWPTTDQARHRAT